MINGEQLLSIVISAFNEQGMIVTTFTTIKDPLV